MPAQSVTTFEPAGVAFRTAAFSPLPLFAPAGFVFRTAAFAATTPGEHPPDPLRGINRIVTGRTAAAEDAPPRGTHGLMPPEWGRIVSFDIEDAGVDYEIRHTGGKLVASGQSSGRLTLAMTLRLPSSAELPARGDTFMHPWRGANRRFVVWNVSPVWTIRGVRLIDVAARHELDLGNVFPVAVPVPSYPNL